MIVNRGILGCEGSGREERPLSVPAQKMKRTAPAVLGRENTPVLYKSWFIQFENEPNFNHRCYPQRGGALSDKQNQGSFCVNKSYRSLRGEVKDET